VLQGAAQAELQAPQAVGQQVAAALQQFEVGQQLSQLLPQPRRPRPQPEPHPSHEVQELPQPEPQAPHGAAQLPQPVPQPVPQPPQGAAQLLPQGAAQLEVGQQWFEPQQP
jgi:hypothetical protein